MRRDIRRPLPDPPSLPATPGGGRRCRASGSLVFSSDQGDNPAYSLFPFASSPSKGRGIAAAPSSQNRACPFPSTRLKPLERPVKDATKPTRVMFYSAMVRTTACFRELLLTLSLVLTGDFDRCDAIEGSLAIPQRMD